jgi:two-component system, LytTR family, response regulator AlgR
MSALQILVADDEDLARARLVRLIEDMADPAYAVVAQASNAAQAMQVVTHRRIDVVLLDINMPGASGLQLAQSLAQLTPAPAVIFVTAHREHALAAFEVSALDYLTKPVRAERLLAALQRARSRTATEPLPANLEEALLIVDRGRTERVPLSDVIFIKAELKYLTVRTATRSLLMEGALGELEARYGERLLRVHRSALVAKAAMRSLEKHSDPEEGEGWALRLDSVAEPIPVSRRQLASVREILKA